MRDQIRAVYDCGYDEWLLWDAACTYDWEGLLTPEAASEEDERIAASRAELPETTYAPEEEGHDALTVTEGTQNGDGAAVGENSAAGENATGSAGQNSAAVSGRAGTGLTVGNFPAAQALSEALETAEEPGTPPETGTTLPPTA